MTRLEAHIVECAKVMPSSSVLLYHVVCTAKCRRVVFSETVDEIVREVCLGIA